MSSGKLCAMHARPPSTQQLPKDPCWMSWGVMPSAVSTHTAQPYNTQHAQLAQDQALPYTVAACFVKCYASSAPSLELHHSNRDTARVSIAPHNTIAKDTNMMPCSPSIRRGCVSQSYPRTSLTRFLHNKYLSVLVHAWASQQQQLTMVAASVAAAAVLSGADTTSL